MVTALFLLPLLGACKDPAPVTDKSGEDAVLTPWEDLEARNLVPFRTLRDMALNGAEGAHQVVVAEPENLGGPLTFVLDTTKVHILDWLYRTGVDACLEAAAWPSDIPDDGTDRQGDCGEGQVQLQRGSFTPDAARLGVAAGGGWVYVLSAAGTVYRASTDPLGAAPVDLLRFEEFSTVAVNDAAAAHHLAMVGQELIVVSGYSIQRISGETGASTGSGLALAPVLSMAIVEDEPWLLSASGLEIAGERFVLDELELADFSEIIADGSGGAWISGATLLAHVDAAGAVDDTSEVGDPVGPLARSGDTVYVSAASGAVRPSPSRRRSSPCTSATC